MGATRQLAEFAASTSFGGLPPEVIAETKQAILNYLGVALGGCRHELVGILSSTVDDLGGLPQATILGSGRRTSVLHAATINGAASHLLDYDDTHLATVIHPTGPVMAAALSLAEWKRLSGRQLLTAQVVGAEVNLRIGAAVYPSHYDLGWHISGTAGTFGAAAASGRLLDLDPDRLSHALGIAGSHASGLREMFGSMTKSLHIGHAASSGLWAALLAEKGFTSSLQVLEAKRGFCAVLAPEYDLSRATEGLGRRYLLLDNGIKPYACGVVTHPTIDGVRRLRQRYAIQPSDVREIETRVHPLVLELTGKKAPRTALEAKFSVYYCAAIALMEGAARESQFTDDKVVRQDIVSLRGRVRAVVEPGMGESQAVVIVRTVDGRELVERVEAGTGTPSNKMPESELLEKFMELAVPVVGREKAGRIVGLVGELESLEDVSPLVELCSP